MTHTFKQAFVKTINNSHIELESEGKTYSMDNCSVESIVDGNITIKYNCPFKEGDYVNVWDLIHGSYVTCIFKLFDGDLHYYISEPFPSDKFHRNKLRYNNEWIQCHFWLNDVFPATQADIDRLNSKLKDKGKVWNPETKQVEKYRWKPEKGELYFYVLTSMSGVQICRVFWHDDNSDHLCYDTHNCFQTEKQVKKAAEEIKKLLKSL